MKYFEKNADIQYALKGMVKGFKAGTMDLATAADRIKRLAERKKNLMQYIDLNPNVFDQNPAMVDKVHRYSKMLVGSNMLYNKRQVDLLKLGAAPVHPMQGTLLNVQTRESQTKYNSKVLGKKRADILVPLWR